MLTIPTTDIPHKILTIHISLPLHDTIFDGVSPVDTLTGEKLFFDIANAINEAYYPFRHMELLSKLHNHTAYRNDDYLCIEYKTRLPLHSTVQEIMQVLSAILTVDPKCQSIMELNRYYTAEEILEHC